jgi:PRTRC genetic system ThiF family protein
MNTFNPNYYIQRVVLVGCGGTGAQVARIVGRILYDMHRSKMNTPKLVLIDPDIVEDHNVGRQLFTSADASQKRYKAEVVGRRLNTALGLDVSWYTKPINKHHLENSDLVLSCVDNHIPRRIIHEHSGLMIGAGNHRDSGQIVIGNTIDPNRVKLNVKTQEYNYLPREGLYFPTLLEPEETPLPDLSCAELVERGEQDLLVNDWMATIMGQYVYQVLHRLPIVTFMTFVSLNGITVKSIPITPENLAPYLSN